MRCGSHLWEVQLLSVAAVSIAILSSLVTTTNGPSCDLSSHCTQALSTGAGVEDIEPLFLRSEVRTKEAHSRILFQHGESAVRSSQGRLGCVWDVTGRKDGNVLRWGTG